MTQQPANDLIIHGKSYEIHVITNTLNSNRYANFKLEFNPILTLTNLQEHPEMKNSRDDEWEMCLIKCSFWNTMNNVMASLGNNTFRYTVAGVPTTITLPDGNYTLQSINNAIDYYFATNGLSTGNLVFGVNTATSKANLLLKATYAVDFTHASNIGIALLLGFTGVNANNTAGVNVMIASAVAEPQLNYYGANRVLIETIQVRVDIINHRVYANQHNSINAERQDILYEFGISSSPATLQVERNQNSHYIKIRQMNEIPNMRISFTNQDGVELPLNKEATCQFQLRRNMEHRIQKAINSQVRRY